MAKGDDVVRLLGIIEEAMPNNKFRVRLYPGVNPELGTQSYRILREEISMGSEDTTIVLAGMAGKMRLNHIRVIQGDYVTVEVSLYNLEEGRIVHREK
jgi:translation initiation factor IF-1